MFMLNILEAVLVYDLVKIRFIKEKEVILNGNTNDKSRGIQLIGSGYLQKVFKGVNWLLSPITNWSLQLNIRTDWSVFVNVHMTKVCFLNYPKCVQWRFWLACANAQADLNLRWTHMFEGSFSDVAAQSGYRAQISIDVAAIEN